VINDISQGNVATSFRNVDLLLILYYKFTAESALQFFLHQSMSGEDTGKKFDCFKHRAPGTVLLKMENLFEI